MSEKNQESTKRVCVIFVASAMSFLRKIVENIPLAQRLLAWAKKVKLPGFDGVPLYDVLVFLRNEIRRNVITVRAKAIAFTFFLALFPGIIFIFTLIPYIPVENLQSNLMNFIRDLLPYDAYRMLEDTITGVVKKQRFELLSVGFIMALFVSTNGVMAMMESFDKSYAVFVKRSVLLKRFVALKLTIVLFILLVLSLILIVAGNHFLKYLLDTFHILNKFNFYLFSTLKWLIIILLFFNSISFIYYYGPAVKKKFRFISAGSTLATFLVILISIGFSIFVNSFGQYNRFYGSIGTIIALQIYIYLNAFALLLGFELNASIAISKNILKHHPAENFQDGNV